MIRFLLDPTHVLILLAALAIATPLAAAIVGRLRPTLLGRRPRLALAAAGPFALVYWGFHNLVLKLVGFDSIFSVMIVVGVAALIGWFVGGSVGKKGTEGTPGT